MHRIGLYEALQPFLGRRDVFHGVRRFQAEASPFPVLILVPQARELAFRAAFRHHMIESMYVPDVVDLGVEGERCYYALGLGRALPSGLRPFAGSVPFSSWRRLAQALAEIHEQGLAYGGVHEDAIALTEGGQPILYDFLRTKSLENGHAAERVQADILDLALLAERLAPEAPVARALSEAQGAVTSMRGVLRCLDGLHQEATA